MSVAGVALVWWWWSHTSLVLDIPVDHRNSLGTPLVMFLRRYMLWCRKFWIVVDLSGVRNGHELLPCALVETPTHLLLVDSEAGRNNTILSVDGYGG